MCNKKVTRNRFSLKYKTGQAVCLQEYVPCDGYHLFEVHADYARRSPDGCTYYVIERNARQARERFKNLLPWMHIYFVSEVFDMGKAGTVLKSPDKYIII